MHSGDGWNRVDAADTREGGEMLRSFNAFKAGADADGLLKVEPLRGETAKRYLAMSASIAAGRLGKGKRIDAVGDTICCQCRSFDPARTSRDI